MSDGIAALKPPVQVPLTLCPPQACPYLPDRVARNRAFLSTKLPPELYHDFMDAGFRRAGRVVYQPVCDGCSACVPIRVAVSGFEPNKSQRRCRRRNNDLRYLVGRPAATQEKHDLYCRYVEARHRGGLPREQQDEEEGFVEFLYRSPVDSIEICHRDASGRLFAVGICDVCPSSLSSVYFYFDPDETKRGLGNLGALVEIELAQRLGIEHYYLGYWISGCRAMEYKAGFRPCEFLHPDGQWRDEPPRGRLFNT